MSEQRRYYVRSFNAFLLFVASVTYAVLYTYAVILRLRGKPPLLYHWGQPPEDGGCS